MVAQGETFAVATVVRCQAPSSGKPGDKAIVRGNEIVWGWIGGGCAQPVVVKEAVKAMAEGRARLVRISPSAGGGEEGVVDYTMTCHSGGSLDIHIEPVLPQPYVLILGRSPVAQTLARLARTIGYAVSVVAEEGGGDYGDARLVAAPGFNLGNAGVAPQTFVVVSTQGEGDEEALEQALKSNAHYVAFVASKTKAQKVFEYLRGRGIEQTRLDQVRAPAGLNIAAASPEEIAVSILAEIIQARGSSRQGVAQAKAAPALPILSNEAKDPVCGMMVDVTKAKYRSQYHGKAWYFCCAGCKEMFEKQPEKYLAAQA